MDLDNENDFLNAIETNPNTKNRLKFADWLENQEDRRGEIIRGIENGDLSVIGDPRKNPVQDAALTQKEFVLYAIECAEYVLHFWEGVYPDDDGIKKAIQAAQNVINNLDESDSRAKTLGEDAESAGNYALSAADLAIDDAEKASPLNFINTEFFYAGTAAYAAGHAAHTAACLVYPEDVDCVPSCAAECAGAFGGDAEIFGWNLKRLAEYKYFNGKKLWT